MGAADLNKEKIDADVEARKSQLSPRARSPPKWDREERPTSATEDESRLPVIDPRLGLADNPSDAPADTSRTPEGSEYGEERRYQSNKQNYEFYPPPRRDSYEPPPPELHPPPVDGPAGYRSMSSHRYEPYPAHYHHSMPPQRQYSYEQRYSPPPGSMPLRRSPASSVASGMNTPDARRSPPPNGHYLPPASHYERRVSYEAPPPPPEYHYSGPPPMGYGSGPGQGGPRYDPRQSPQPYYPPSREPYYAPPPSVPSQAHLGHPNAQITFTDDSTVKLSEFVRRRCYNCSTTDTSTWRRSNIAPGKVLCNKCGLFERTHRKARPDQLAHRRQSTGNGRNTYQGSPIPVGPGQNGGAMPPMHNTYYSEAYHTQHSESFQPPPMPPPPPQMPSGSVHYRLRDPPSKQDTPANADYHNHIPPVDSEERRSSPRLSSAAAETAA